MVGTGSQFLAIRGLETRARPGTGPTSPQCPDPPEHAAKVRFGPGGCGGLRCRRDCRRFVSLTRDFGWPVLADPLAVCPRLAPVVRYALSSLIALSRPTISLMGVHPSIRTASMIPASHAIQVIPTFGIIGFHRKKLGRNPSRQVY
jgi:hypothetical protein